MGLIMHESFQVRFICRIQVSVYTVNIWSHSNKERCQNDLKKAIFYGRPEVGRKLSLYHKVNRFVIGYISNPRKGAFQPRSITVGKWTGGCYAR